MLIKRSLFQYLFVILSLLSNKVNAQKYISASAGYSAGSLFDFNRDYVGHDTQFGFKNGYFTSLSLEGLGQNKKLRLGLQFGNQQIVSDESKGSHYSHYAWIYDVKFQYFQLDFAYLFSLIAAEKVNFNLFLGPTISYNSRTDMDYLHEHSQIATSIDSLGQSHTWFYVIKDDYPREVSTKFTGINVGLNVGFSISFPLKEKLDLVFENKYSLFFYQKINFEDVLFPTFFRGDLSLGLKFRI